MIVGVENVKKLALEPYETFVWCIVKSYPLKRSNALKY
jgi:hypothetical protein